MRPRTVAQQPPLNLRAADVVRDKQHLLVLYCVLRGSKRAAEGRDQNKRPEKKKRLRHNIQQWLTVKVVGMYVFFNSSIFV